MEIRDLTYFLAVLEEGHLTRAARSLHLAQPTLSHAMARLEEQAGEPLLERPRPGRPRITATAAGALLADRARRILGEVRGFDDDVSALRGVLRGEVRIGSMQTLNSTLLPSPLARYASSYAAVSLSLHTLAAEDIPRALREGRLDVGLLAGAPAEVLRGLAVKQLNREQLVAVVRADHALGRRRTIELGRLANQQFVLMLPGTFTYQLVLAACARAGFSPQVRLTLESGEAIREVVRAGLGMTILPAGYINANDPSLRSIALTHPTPKREVVAAWEPRFPPAAATRAFLDMLSEGAPAVQRDRSP